MFLIASPSFGLVSGGAVDSLVAYVLTFDEEVHVRAVIQSLKRVTNDVVIVDSASGDKTQDLAREAGAIVWERPFETHAAQHTWAIERIREVFDPDWILTLDADERLSDALVEEIRTLDAGKPGPDVYLLPRRLRFCGRVLRFGGFARTRLPRLFRPSSGAYEQREINEHFIPVEGARIGALESPIVHEDVASWERYIEKHNHYSTLEALVRWRAEGDSASGVRVGQAFRFPHLRRRWLRVRILNRLPAKPLFRFLQLYFFYGGFLDGSAGFNIALFMSWQEMCTDLKFRELERRRRRDRLE